MTNPAHTLDAALRTMTFRVLPEPYALVAFPRARHEEAVQLTSRVSPHRLASLVFENDTVTVFVPEELLLTVESAHGVRVERQQRVITFETPMAWDVVGFLALVTRVLAEGQIPLGAICAFDRDHIFVNEKFLEAARAALRAFVCAEAAG